MQVTYGAIQTVPLVSGDIADPSTALTIRTLLFGEMLDRVRDLITGCRFDLYHDAMWIESFVTGECAFFWGADDHGMGTHISEDLGPYRVPAEPLYKIYVRRDPRGLWLAAFETITQS